MSASPHRRPAGASLAAHLHRPIARLIGRRLVHAETPAEIRAVFDRTSRLLFPPRGTRATRVSLGGVPALRVTTRSPAAPGRALLVLHGGGYVFGTPGSYLALAARFADAARATAFLPDYRLAPEAPYPAACEDALAAYRGLLREHAPRGIAFVGDSAGGGLALATLHRARDAGVALPACAVLMSPWLDPGGSGASMLDNAASEILILPPTIARCAAWYAGDRDPADPGIAPLFGSQHGLPPILVQVSANEMLYSDSTRFVDRATAAGVEVVAEIEPDLWHVWQAMAPTLPEARRAITSAGRFIAAHTG